MGVQQSLHPESRLLHLGADLGAIAAGIHDDPSARVRIPQQAAVATQGADRKGFEFQHGSRLIRFALFLLIMIRRAFKR